MTAPAEEANAMNSVLPDDGYRSFSAIVREFIAQAGGDTAAAGEALAKAILEDDEMRARYLNEAVRQWAVDRVRIERSKVKYAAGASVAKVVAMDGSVFREAAQASADRLMDTAIWGGKPVRQATQSDLRLSADKHFRQAQTMSHHGRWQIALAEALSRNGNSEDTVGQCLTENKVAQLWRETENG